MYRLLLAVSLVFALLAGCSSDVKTEIVGEWRGVDGHQDLVFYTDGQIQMKSPRHSDYWGQYSIRDGNKMTFDFPRLAKAIECSAKIRGTKLTLAHPGGREEDYVKK